MAKKAKLSASALAFFREQGAKGGKVGGKRSLETMTPEARVERARRAGLQSTKNMTAEARAERARKAGLAAAKARARKAKNSRGK